MTRPALASAARLGCAMLAISAVACSSKKTTATRTPLEQVEPALAPASIAASLRASGGGHVRGSSMQRVSVPKREADETALPDAVTTTTDVWIDRHGQYRLLETNDRDGGREVILHGRTLAVALRYGKMIRRPAQEPEPTRYLEEALGAPQAAWDVARRFLAVEKAAEGVYRLLKVATPEDEAPAIGDAGPLQSWRQTVQVTSLTGEVRLDPASGALRAFKLQARFGLERDGAPLDGELAVDFKVDGLGTTPSIGPPIAEELRPRQRTILEERALLGRDATPSAKSPAAPAPPQKGK